MKTYHLQVITGNKSLNSGTYLCTCRAASFRVSEGVYVFAGENEEIIACYPVDRTIIYKIEHHEQQ